MKVCFFDTITEVNLEHGDYVFDTIYPVDGNVPYPLVVLGETDTVKSISITSETEPLGLDTAGYFLRNGTITFTQSA